MSEPRDLREGSDNGSQESHEDKRTVSHPDSTAHVATESLVRGYEIQELDLRAIVRFGLGLLAATIVIYVVLWWLIAAQTDPICVCDVVGRFELTQPTISYHLKLLRQAGLVTVSQRGVWAYYAVDPEGLEILRAAPAELAPGQLAEVS